MSELEQRLDEIFQYTYSQYLYNVKYDKFENIYWIKIFNVPAEEHLSVCETLWTTLSNYSDLANITWAPVLFTIEQTAKAYPEYALVGAKIESIIVSNENWQQCAVSPFYVSCNCEQDEYALAA